MPYVPTPAGYYCRYRRSDMPALTTWSTSRTSEARMVERARGILRCINGDPVQNIARDLGIRPNTVIDWRRRFVAEGITGLFDRDRPGKPRQYPVNFRSQKYAAVLDLPPPEGPGDLGRKSSCGPPVMRRLTPFAACSAQRRHRLAAPHKVGASALIPSLPAKAATDCRTLYESA